MTVATFLHIVCLLLSIIHITRSSVSVYTINSSKSVEDFDDQIASFSPAFPSDGLKGYIITTNPPTACTAILPPPGIPTIGYHWIALIPRTRGNDSCEFARKVQNAQNANFSAVIIHNYEDVLFSMAPAGRKFNIPSTLISYSDGLSLIRHYLYNSTAKNSTIKYYAKILPDQPFDFRVYLISFLTIIGASILILIGFALARFYFRRQHSRLHRLPRSALKQLKIKKFTKTDPWEVCAICLDDYEEGAKIRILPCDHAYHVKCIDPWLVNNRRQCPVCKRYIFPGHDNPDVEESGDRQQPRTPTEQTPLIFANRVDPLTERSSSDQQVLSVVGSGLPRVSFASSDLSCSLEDLPTSSRTTTTEVVSDRPSFNPRRYGSVHNSTSKPATHDPNATTHGVVEDVSDIETVDEDNDDDERMHSVLTGSEENPAYVDDEEPPTNVLHTHL